MRTNSINRIIIGTVMVIAFLALTFGSVTSAFAQDGYLLAGTVHPSNRVQMDNDHRCDARWETSGRLWQPNLPRSSERQWFAVAFELVPGRYEANAVACRMYVDEDRSGGGSSERQVLDHENGVQFDVRTPTGLTAYALVECDGGVSTGFEVLWQGSDGFNVNTNGILGISDNGGQGGNNPTPIPATPNYTPATPMPQGNQSHMGDNGNPYGLTVASCTENRRDGWVLPPSSDSRWQTAQSCDALRVFNTNDCPAQDSLQQPLDVQKSNQNSVCTYFPPEQGTEAQGSNVDILGGLLNILRAIASFLWNNLLLVIIVLFLLWLWFYGRRPAVTDHRVLGDPRTWRNPRNGNGAAHDAHDTAAEGDIVIHDAADYEVTGTVGQPFNFVPSFTGEEVITKWETLPAGVTMINRETGELDGTPTRRGTFMSKLTVKSVDNPAKVAVRRYKFVIGEATAAPAPVVDNTNTGATNGGTNANGLVTITMPGGVTMTGTVEQIAALRALEAPQQGEPDAGNNAAGFDRTVRQPAQATRQHVPYNGQLAITTESLQHGVVGQEYRFGIRVNNPDANYRRGISWTALGLNPGLRMLNNGLIVGVPTQQGTERVHVVGTHTDGSRVEGDFDLTVDAAQTQIANQQ